ncbi:MAG TPA: DUF1080 domain-containing protein, partial [Lacipirellulaceae bacterium]|nr:DUF1080 domain-containing protein [Lacipirellulaceae bacterium]
MSWSRYGVALKMNVCTWLSRPAALALLILLVPAVAPAADETPEPDADGWDVLFDGKSLDGWRAAENPESFRVEDGVIVVAGPRAHLFYSGPVEDHDFTNFELKLEANTEPGANSGVYIHTKYQDAGWPDHGYVFAARQFVSHGHILVNGKRIALKVDGQPMVDFTQLGVPPQHAGAGRKLSSGTIALQAHDPGSVVRYRNIRIKPLK